MHLLTDSTNHLRRLMINRGASIVSVQQTETELHEQVYTLTDDLRRQQVFVVAAIWPDAQSLFDLLAVFRLLRDNRCPSPGLIIPYLAYAGKCDQPGQAKTNEMIAELVRNLNPTKIYFLDIHDQDLLNTFGGKAGNVPVLPLVAERINKDSWPEMVVGADQSAAQMAEALAEHLGPAVTHGFVEMARPRPNSVSAKKVHAAVLGKKVLIVDDFIQTGRTMSEAVRLVAKGGASQIQIAATHGLFDEAGRTKLLRLPVQDILVSNSLPQPRNSQIKIIDISSLILTLQ